MLQSLQRFAATTLKDSAVLAGPQRGAARDVGSENAATQRQGRPTLRIMCPGCGVGLGGSTSGAHGTAQRHPR